MSDVETRARDALNEQLGQLFWGDDDRREDYPTIEAMCRQIEAHDATKAAINRVLRDYFDGDIPSAFVDFILPEPVDPLVEVLSEIDSPALHPSDCAAQLREGLAKCGLTITERQP